MTPPPKVDEMSDEEAGRKYKERARQNRLKQQEFRRRMQAEGMKRISAYITGEAKAVMERLAVTHGINTGDVISKAILHYDETNQGVSGKHIETNAEFWRSEYDKVAAELREYRGVIFGGTANDEDEADSVSGNDIGEEKEVSGNEADPSEILERIADMEKDSSRKDVAARLNAEGYRTARGGKWTASKLNAFLQRQKKKGTE